MKRSVLLTALVVAASGLAFAQQPPVRQRAPAPPAVQPAPPAGDMAGPPGGWAPDEGALPAPPGGPPPERGWRREGGQAGIPAAFMERLRQERPELHERLSRLYREDRPRFFQEVREMMRERAPEQAGEGGRGPGRVLRESPEEQKCAELSRLYLEARDEAEKERLKGELAEAVHAAFEARLRASKERVARLEEQLADFRQRLERMEANRDRICQDRVEELTKPPELRWDGNW